MRPVIRKGSVTHTGIRAGTGQVRQRVHMSDLTDTSKEALQTHSE